MSGVTSTINKKTFLKFFIVQSYQMKTEEMFSQYYMHSSALVHPNLQPHRSVVPVSTLNTRKD